MIGIIDYNAGNITSVGRALDKLGIEHILSKNPDDLKNCNKVIFPGVGDAAYAMGELKKSGFAVEIRNRRHVRSFLGFHLNGSKRILIFGHIILECHQKPFGMLRRHNDP